MLRLMQNIGEQKQITTEQVKLVVSVGCVAFVPGSFTHRMYYFVHWKHILGRLAFLTHNE